MGGFQDPGGRFASDLYGVPVCCWFPQHDQRCHRRISPELFDPNGKRHELGGTVYRYSGTLIRF